MVYCLTSCLDFFVTSHTPVWVSLLFYFEGPTLCVFSYFLFPVFVGFPSILIVCPTLIGYTWEPYPPPPHSVPWLPCYSEASANIICTVSVFLEFSRSSCCAVFFTLPGVGSLDFTSAGFVCVHGLISWLWPTPALQMVSGILIWTCSACDVCDHMPVCSELWLLMWPYSYVV